MARVRQLLLGPEAIALVTLMGAGCMALWIAVPLGWLWVGSQVEASSDLSTGLGVTMIGSVLSIIALVLFLVQVNRRHLELQLRRKGADRPRTSVLELMLVVTAAVAVVIFGIWFLLFAGTSPAPLNISY
ncbi:hypothetical protein BH10ACT11_BH10ACT11_07390 [soil metagenome]